MRCMGLCGERTIIIKKKTTVAVACSCLENGINFKFAVRLLEFMLHYQTLRAVATHTHIHTDCAWHCTRISYLHVIRQTIEQRNMYDGAVADSRPKSRSQQISRMLKSRLQNHELKYISQFYYLLFVCPIIHLLQ